MRFIYIEEYLKLIVFEALSRIIRFSQNSGNTNPEREGFSTELRYSGDSENQKINSGQSLFLNLFNQQLFISSLSLLKMEKIDLTNIPKNPGCYLFKDRRGKIIYVGKAKNLEKRVRSYFQKKDHDPKTEALVKEIYSADFFVTDNEVEALILENNLIKKNYPKYNIDLKDSRRYAYIQITDEKYPRLLIARKREGKGKFYGPFVSGATRDYILDALIKTFKLRTCKNLPKRECLRFSIGLCSAPCTERISHTKYLENVDSAKLVLNKRTIDLIKILIEKMNENSKTQNYEGALQIRKQIEAIKGLSEKQKMERSKNYDEDIINYIIQKEKVYLMLFNSRNGILVNKQDFEFDYTPHFLEEFISRYYSEAEIPRKIITPESVDSSIEEYLNKIKRSKVEIINPKIGQLKDLLELVKKNIEISLFGDQEKIEDLAKELKLNEIPRVIECFDISHLSGTATVASMVQFRNGKADKSNYRKYKIKTVNQIDDFASMKEVIKRRYSKLKFEKLPFPNLVIIDGGKGQLNSVMEGLKELNLNLVVISLAKREEEVFLPNKSDPIILPRKGKALRLIQSIRDEAHRFAITYNRKLRSKEMLK